MDYEEALKQAEAKEAERLKQIEEDVASYYGITNPTHEIIYEGVEPEEMEEHIINPSEPVVNRMLDIKFKPGEDHLAGMQVDYNRLGYDALFMTHYQLSSMTSYTPIQWKEFITDPRVSAFISEEMELLKKAKVASMLRDSDRSKNVGQAQLLNTLLNQTKGMDKKEGPAFVYCWVPLNSNEQHATNVEVQDVSLTEYFENQERPSSVQ